MKLEDKRTGVEVYEELQMHSMHLWPQIIQKYVDEAYYRGFNQVVRNTLDLKELERLQGAAPDVPGSALGAANPDAAISARAASYIPTEDKTLADVPQTEDERLEEAGWPAMQALARFFGRHGLTPDRIVLEVSKPCCEPASIYHELSIMIKPR